MAGPPKQVLDAFGAGCRAVRLMGGRGETYLADEIILKPIADAEEAEWSGAVLSTIRQDGFRTPRPIETCDGHFAKEGWSAFEFIEGETVFGDRFTERFAASRAFHRSLAHLDPPPFLGLRQDPWAVADRITWNTVQREPHPRVEPVLGALRDLERPIDLRRQIVHGDIAGNFLAQGEPPLVVIDFTPYWTPAGFGEAVFVVDAALWEGGNLRQLLHLAGIEAQLVVRAAVRRLLEVDCHHRLGWAPESSLDQVDRYRELASLLAALMSGD